MFTGIVEEAGQVHAIQFGKGAIRLAVRSRVCGRDVKTGDSVAVNGCCLTVVKLSGKAGTRVLEFDLLEETWLRTNFKSLQVGSAVNLERSLRADGRLSGHFVTGHIDGTGTIRKWEQQGADWLLEIAPPRDVARYLLFKGTVAVDGISLTVAKVLKKTFRIWIIPHTHEVTALKERKVGDLVNLEADLLGKYVEQFLALRAGKAHR